MWGSQSTKTLPIISSLLLKLLLWHSATAGTRERPCAPLHSLRRFCCRRGEKMTGSVRTGLVRPDSVSSELTEAPCSLLLGRTSKQAEQPAIWLGLQGMHTETRARLTPVGRRVMMIMVEGGGVVRTKNTTPNTVMKRAWNLLAVLYNHRLIGF